MDSTSYISCACNRVPSAADWGRNGLICYGACNAIAIYLPEASRVSQTLHRHTARVNVVRWIKKNGQDETELLSASSDGTAIVWSAQAESYDPTSILVDGNSLTIADGVYLRGPQFAEHRELLVGTGSTEGTFALWRRDDTGDTKKIQSLFFGRRIPTDARLSFLPNSDTPLLAVATDDCSIHVYCRESSNGEIQLVPVQTLQNHEDWIRCMDFTHDAHGNCFLATGSQDSTIRLWKIYEDEEVAVDERRDETRRRIKRFSVGSVNYGITLESILSGHEHWVYGVSWLSNENSGKSTNFQPPKLLSCAMDKSMIIWEADTERGGVWCETVRVGEVGGNSLGFYGCKFAPDGLGILAHGYQGSFHIWMYDESTQGWKPRTGPTGHFSGVVDVCWDPKGR